MICKNDMFQSSLQNIENNVFSKNNVSYFFCLLKVYQMKLQKIKYFINTLRDFVIYKIQNPFQITLAYYLNLNAHKLLVVRQANARNSILVTKILKSVECKKAIPFLKVDRETTIIFEIYFQNYNPSCAQSNRKKMKSIYRQ